MALLFDTLQLGELILRNRMVMAPLTRMRSQQPGDIPNQMNATYYAQRASAGLIISEATQISQQGKGYPATPGIYSASQVAGWKLVTDAVHQKGGAMFLQLWHVGRISHSSHQPGGGLPVAPSAIKASGKTFTADWKQVDFEQPHALEVSEIKAIVADYRRACENAMQAGFDGVEVHAGNGYLLDQFLQDATNQRVDEYGGSIENRARLLLAIVDEAIKVWGHDRVGIRVSPYGKFNDMSDRDPETLFGYVFLQMNQRQLAYVHVIEPRASSAGGSDALVVDAPCTAKLFRHKFNGVLISAGGYTPESAKETLALGFADAIAFGRLFIANPDLPERIHQGAVLNPYNRATFYGGGEKGYIDYPVMHSAS